MKIWRVIIPKRRRKKTTFLNLKRASQWMHDLRQIFTIILKLPRRNASLRITECTHSAAMGTPKLYKLTDKTIRSSKLHRICRNVVLNTINVPMWNNVNTLQHRHVSSLVIFLFSYYNTPTLIYTLLSALYVVRTA